MTRRGPKLVPLEEALNTPVPYDDMWARGAEQVMLREGLDEALATLSTRQRDVLCLRYGLADGETRTLQTIASRLGITKEAVRQTEQRALAKLREPAASRRLQWLLAG